MNQIRNAVKEITKRDLVVCKRCGCPDLAWVQYKSGKWGLVETACRRPMWRGQGPAPVGLYALKFNYHRCAEYQAAKQEAERRASQCHPKADNPREIIADAMGVLIREAAVTNSLMSLSKNDNPLGQAFWILTMAQSSINEPPVSLK